MRPYDMEATLGSWRIAICASQGLNTLPATQKPPQERTGSRPFASRTTAAVGTGGKAACRRGGSQRHLIELHVLLTTANPTPAHKLLLLLTHLLAPN